MLLPQFGVFSGQFLVFGGDVRPRVCGSHPAVFSEIFSFNCQCPDMSAAIELIKQIKRLLFSSGQSVLKVYDAPPLCIRSVQSTSLSTATADSHRLRALHENMMALAVLEQLQSPFGK